MKLHLNNENTSYLIRAYAPGRITVNEEILTRSFIVTPQTLLRDWPPQQFSDLQPEHMRMIADLGPEIVLLGTGERQQFPPPPLLLPLIEASCGIEIMSTDAACRTYDILAGEDRNVAAALLII